MDEAQPGTSSENVFHSVPQLGVHTNTWPTYPQEHPEGLPPAPLAVDYRSSGVDSPFQAEQKEKEGLEGCVTEQSTCPELEPWV